MRSCMSGRAACHGRISSGGESGGVRRAWSTAGVTGETRRALTTTSAWAGSKPRLQAVGVAVGPGLYSRGTCRSLAGNRGHSACCQDVPYMHDPSRV